MPVFREDNAVSRICKQLGRVELVKQVFNAPSRPTRTPCCLSTTSTSRKNTATSSPPAWTPGVPISAIGLQTHQHQGYMGREKLEEVLERFSVFGLPLHFTETPSSPAT